jgi:hypothetical protein
MKMYNFKRDLQFGNIYEKKSFEKLKKYYNDVNLTCIYNNDYKYDFITNTKETFEVKCDMSSNRTGNFFIEYIFNNKPSGIAKTESKYYIITDSIDFYMILTDDLIEYINNNTPKTVRFKSDTGFVSGYLIKKEEFKKIKNVIKI